MLSDSIIYVGIVDTRSYQPWKTQGMERYTFPTVVCQSGRNLSEILKFAGQNSYSERGACNWFYA